LDIEFEYDNQGRILRRVSGSDETLFEWDGLDLVRETAPDGTVTRYFCPQGELHRFQRGSDFYSVHSDALGSVRMIADAAGRVVSHFEYELTARRWTPASTASPVVSPTASWVRSGAEPMARLGIATIVIITSLCAYFSEKLGTKA